jgi:hypothetical protein
MMEAASTFETSVNFYQTTQTNIPEESNLNRNKPLCYIRKENLLLDERLPVSKEVLCSTKLVNLLKKISRETSNRISGKQTEI